MFRVGDLVLQTNDCSGSKAGEKYRVEEYRGMFIICPIRDSSGNIERACSCDYQWKKVSSDNTIDGKVVTL